MTTAAMNAPPVPGLHAGHRPHDTPGPTGHNDHGDPCHGRRGGLTPGPLGLNDYATPLPGKMVLIAAEPDSTVASSINKMIDEATAYNRSRDLGFKLDYCLETVRKLRSVVNSREHKN